MKYKIYKDNNDYIININHTCSKEDTIELSNDVALSDFLNCYRVVDNNVVWDEVKYQRILEEEEEERRKPTKEEKLEAQILYTALLTDSLLESEEE